MSHVIVNKGLVCKDLSIVISIDATESGRKKQSSCLFQAETPIEEFAPTPAFPALQYLESVDQGGVAWRAGLRTGDFLIEVL